MVDTSDLFRKLINGVKFDKSRFKEDAELFKLCPRSKCTTESDAKEALDFFGSSNRKDKNHSLLEETNEQRKESHTKRKKRRHSQGEESVMSDQSEGEKCSYQRKKMAKLKKQKKKESDQQGKSVEAHIEMVNSMRKKNSIHVYGRDIPDPMLTFNELSTRFGVSKSIVRNITESSYENPTPVQMQAIPIMLQNREILACAPTGSGKTVSFIVPVFHLLKVPQRNAIRAVVISPTRELAEQIYREFNRLNTTLGFHIHLLTKAKAKSNNFKTSKCDILISTPNRLVYLLQKDPPGIDLHSVKVLVLDEGDKLFEEGDRGFRDQVAEIYQACDHPQIQRALFSATLANHVEEWCKLHLDNVVRVVVGARNSATQTIEQELLFTGQESGKLLALKQIIQKGFQPPMLIFVQSKERAKELFNELIYDGLNVDVIHAERTQAQRENVVKCFRAGKIWILISTELMGRGIDFKGVNMVINYDFPPSAVSYIHRIGRTGRAGRKGKAVTLFTEDDVVNLRSIANVMKSSGCEIPEWILQLKKPDRKTKKKLTKAPVERESIKTITKYDKEKRKHKRQMIEMSKSKENS